MHVQVECGDYKTDTFYCRKGEKKLEAGAKFSTIQASLILRAISSVG